MEYVKHFAVLTCARKSSGPVYNSTPATFRFVARATATQCGSLIISDFASQFGANEYVSQTLGRLYAIRGRSLNIRANLSLDWRKYQFLLAISAMYEVCGLYVVTRGMRVVVRLSLARKLSSCVNKRTFRISDSILSFL